MDKQIERIAKWDNMKFFLIFCVVLGHISEMYTENYIWFRKLFLYIYIFHMPAFLFVSGIFSGKTIEKRKYKTIFSYLILYFAVKILRNGIRYIIYGKGSISILSESGIAWYAGALFAYCIITLLLQKADMRWVFICSVILSCFAGYDSQIGDWLILSRIIVYYPFFLAGYMLSGKRRIFIRCRTWVKIFYGLIFTTVTVCVMVYGEKIYWLRPLLTGRNPYEQLEMFSEYGCLLRAVYYIIVFAMVFSIAVLIPEKRIPLITAMGGRTLPVYAFHLSVIDILWGICGLGTVIFTYTTGTLMYACIFATALVIVVITSLPIFDSLLKKMITPRLKTMTDNCK